MKYTRSISFLKIILVSLISVFVGVDLFAQADEQNTIVESPIVPIPSKLNVSTIPGLNVSEGDIRAGLLYDAESKTVVWQKDMYYAYPIASLTKMMVALLAIEDIRMGKVDWSDEVKVDRVYKRSRRSRQVYRTTETYSLESLIQLALIPSNNLACSDIAKYLSGDQELFVQRMNEKAISLGMKNTAYSNPSGLPASSKELDNSASPADLLILALEMLKYEELLKITSIGYAEVSNDKRTNVFRNHNHLVIDYENDVDGLKTGYTKRAKFCLVATSKKEGHRLISIVLGVNGPYQRNEIVASMLNDYYSIIGCGSMIPSDGGPVAKKSLVRDPAGEEIDAESDSNYTYKTVWVKQRQQHVVRSGETLSAIAQRYGTTYQQVKKWNRLSSNTIMKGQRLYVYASVPKKVAVKNAKRLDSEDETDAETDESTMGVTTQIVASDSVYDDSSTTQVATTKQVAETKKPVAQAVVKKSAPVNSAQPKSSKPIAKQYVYHIVQPGDTLWGIAQRYDGISVADLKRNNKIYNSKTLMPGTKLKIKVKANI